jgi:hypothetical protein
MLLLRKAWWVLRTRWRLLRKGGMGAGRCANPAWSRLLKLMVAARGWATPLRRVRKNSAASGYQ